MKEHLERIVSKGIGLMLEKAGYDWTEKITSYHTPTQSLARDFLREKHGIEIWVAPNNLQDKECGYHWCVASRETAEVHMRISGNAAYFDEALESALYNALDRYLKEIEP